MLDVDAERRLRHGCQPRRCIVGPATAEGLDPDVAVRRLAIGPGGDLDMASAARRHPGEGRRVVYDEADLLAAVAEVGGEPPGDADVAEVVDDAAEDAPL